MTTPLHPVNPQSLVPYPTQNCINNPDHDYSDLQRVMAALTNRDYSDNSRKAIVGDIKHFAEWYERRNAERFAFSRVAERDISDYKADAQKSNLAAATINRRLTTLAVLFEIAIQEGIYDRRNPTANVRKLAPKSLSDADTRRLLKEIEVRGSLRDRAIIELMLGAGMRVSEVAALRVEDIDLSERKGTATVRHSKAGRSRTVPLNLQCRTILNQYVKSAKPNSKLFSGQRDTFTSKASGECSPAMLVSCRVYCSRRTSCAIRSVPDI